MKKTKVISTILMALSLGAFSAMAITAQAKKHQSHSATQGKKEMAPDHMMMMANEPHHALAMAYQQNLIIFAKTLQEQTAGASSVNVAFARAAVTEMWRSFEQMKQHHQQHMQTMSAEMRAKMTSMMQQMETHQTELNTRLTTLDKEVQLSTPSARKVYALVTGVSSHLSAMSKMHQGSKGSKMKMKM